MNKVELIGRTTKDVNVETKNGIKYAKLTVAVDEGKDRTTFVPVSAFGRVAEGLESYVGKGSLIAVSGRVNVSHIDDRLYVNIVASRIEYLATKKPGVSNEPPVQEDIPF